MKSGMGEGGSNWGNCGFGEVCLTDEKLPLPTEKIPPFLPNEIILYPTGAKTSKDKVLRGGEGGGLFGRRHL